MAIAETYDQGVEIATDEDIRIAVATTLNRLGMTYEQLAEQAETGAFSSEQARIAWMALRDLADFR